MTAAVPLTENAGRRMQNVNKVCIRWIQVAWVVRAGVDEDCRIQARYSSYFAFFGLEVVSDEAAHVCADRVADEMHEVWRDSPRVPRDVFDQLRNAKTGKSRRPFELT